MSWINLHALWKIVVVGLLAGAGLPAVFAIGLRAISLGPKNDAGSLRTTTGTGSRGTGLSSGSRSAGGGSAGGTASGGGQYMLGGSTAGLLGGALCFAIVLGGIAWGIYFVVAGS